MKSSGKNVLIIGSGLGSLATALRLAVKGYKVKILEKDSQAGGRLNQYRENGFTFDLGPSFMSMTFEFDDLFRDCGIKNPLKMIKLDPLYRVQFRGNSNVYNIYTDLNRLAEEFNDIEPDFYIKAVKYLDKASEFYHDTENKVIRKNFNNLFDYLLSISSVPFKHLPYLKKNLWKLLEQTFDSEEVKVIFSLVAFFLGSTPFKTPSVYSLLNYTEFRHNGYWAVEGGMYKIVGLLLEELDKLGVEIIYNTEISGIGNFNGNVESFTDKNGKSWYADLFIVNADAASFRGQVLKRKDFSEKKLDAMEWSLAPFTVYLGIKGKINNLYHHNYFLGNDFSDYAAKIFTSSVISSKPYYYVNMSSYTDKSCAPEGCENLFILCPVPDLRFKKDWNDKEVLAGDIIKDLSERISFDLESNILVKKILSPDDWESKFNLYRGSGLGLSHGMMQVGGFRPSNKDEKFNNLFYVGASTVPGTGLPMVLISSKLVTERLLNEH